MRLSRSLLYGSAPYHLSLLGRAPAALALRLDQPWPGDPARGAALLAGAFSFAGETAQAAMPPWTAPMPTQWLAGLHGFSWLADLAATGEATAAQAARRWTADWLVRCDAWDAIAWRADVTGDRLFAWIEHMDTLAGGAEEAAARKRLVASIARQARHLARVAAREAMGVKRLAALRGLVAAVAALGGERRLERVLARLAREIVAQILPDGGHAARSPAAQLAALRYLVDARAALRARQVEVPAALQSAIDRAAPMLRFFRHGDGTLALFNGADEGETALTDRVLARADAKGRPPPSAPYAGFQRAQAGRTLVLADTGVPARPGFDGDAHAGTLSFEMSHGRERLVVNCGGYQRTSSDWRNVARATAAHSTLIVADTNSSEIGAHGGLGRCPTHVPCERIEDGGSHWVSASHDGYQPVFGLTHARQFFVAADGEDLRGEDRLTGPAGRSFAIRFHLHPQVQASLTQDGAAALLRLPSGTGWRLRAQGAVMSLAESVYLGGGDVRKSQQVVLDGHVGSGGATVKWALRREAKKPAEDGDSQS
ncbi:MAG TPA: heparinase II/III family protein [Stellaceae bacterium]